MYTAYILQSEVNGQYYYGSTERPVQERLIEHNEGQSYHTRKYKPWRLVWFGVFGTKKKAQEFEMYLKTPSGHAFLHKRFL